MVHGENRLKYVRERKSEKDRKRVITCVREKRK